MDDVGLVALAPGSEPFERDGRAWVTVTRVPVVDARWPYGEAVEGTDASTAEVPLVPYHEWAERGPSTMRVWIPVAE